MVTAANVARLVATEAAARWTAVAVAAITTNIAINAVAVKGELLALPFLMGSLWLALLAVRDRSWVHALGAGLLAGLALGFKQNLVGGMVFTAVLFVASAVAGRITRADLARLAARRDRRRRDPGAGHGRVGVVGRGGPRRALVRRLRVPLRRRAASSRPGAPSPRRCVWRCWSSARWAPGCCW